MLKNRNSIVVGVFVGFVMWTGAFGPQAIAAPYYEGKTLVVIEGRRPGGTGSLRTQATMNYVRKHLSGNPSIVYKYMPGGGGTAAANHMAIRAKRDGLTIANIGTGLYSNAMFGSRGVRYKLEDFVFLGTGTSGGPYLLVVRPGLGLDSVEKLRAHRGLRFGQRSVGHSMYTLDRLMAFILELNEPKWILGYSSAEIIMALGRDEADAQSTNLFSFVRRNRLETLKEGYTIPVYFRNTKGRGGEFVPQFPQRPHVDDYADTKLKRDVLNFHNSSRPGGSNFLVTKGIPDRALKALQQAFAKTWKDPKFAKEFKKLTGEPADPVTGEEIHRALERIPADPEIKKIYKQIVGVGPLPPAR